MTIDHNLHNLEMQSLEYLLSTHLPLVLARRVLSDGFLRFGFLAVTVYGHTFTAVTRVRIPSGTPNRINNLSCRRCCHPIRLSNFSQKEIWARVAAIYLPTV
jgi:hypothetical protein